MRFTDLFRTSSKTPPPQYNNLNSNINRSSEYIFDLSINQEIERKLLKTINNNISSDVTKHGSSVMNHSMQVDIPRMNYYINGQKISVPGSEQESIVNYSNIIMRPENQWIQENIGALSSFMHQGIFPDFFGAVDSWTASNGEIWNIEMITLDRNHTENDFYISSSGIVKIISQAKVKNVMLKGGDFVLADVNNSHFSLQLSFCVVKNNGRCMVTPLMQGSDRCRLKVKKTGMM